MCGSRSTPSPRPHEAEARPTTSPAVQRWRYLDVKSGGVPDAATAQAIVTDLTKVLDEYPVAVVSSGHGWHVYWALDTADGAWTLDTEPKRVAAQSVYRRFHRLAAHIAERHGAGVDNISDLSRILRVPGTFNRKDPSGPIAVKLFTAHPYGGGAPMSIDQVTEVLTCYGVPETDEYRAVAGAVVSEASAWEFGRQTTAYVEAMVTGWSKDRPDVGRHGWLVSQAVRLACARRLGRITGSDYRQATEALEARFKELLRTHGDRRDPTPGEVPGALAWGVWRASTLTDELATDEVGGADGEDQQADVRDGGEVYLPAEFFESRASLRQIRDAALSYPAAPDATLLAALARISAAIPPSVRVKTGSMAPLPLHLYADLVSPTGAGKSTAIAASDKSVDVRPEWADDVLGVQPDGVLIPADELFPHVAKPRTSAGNAEQFWGMIPDLMDPKKKVRARVRSNVLLLTDEGSGLVKLVKDDKETVGETLRDVVGSVDRAEQCRLHQVPAGQLRHLHVRPRDRDAALGSGWAAHSRGAGEGHAAAVHLLLVQAQPGRSHRRVHRRYRRPWPAGSEDPDTWVAVVRIAAHPGTDGADRVTTG